jgi:hypothetical protein
MSLLPDQPREVARLLNPCFCAALLQRTVEGFDSEEPRRPMPLLLAYLVLPLVLHEPTRESMPAAKATKFSTWVIQHPEIRSGLSERIAALLPFTTSGLSILTRTGVLTLGKKGELARSQVRVAGVTSYPKVSVSVGACWSKALLLGKLMSSVPRAARIWISLGVRP